MVYITGLVDLIQQKWVQSQGFRPGQALMLWKRLYGNDIWAHSIDELEGWLLSSSLVLVFAFHFHSYCIDRPDLFIFIINSPLDLHFMAPYSVDLSLFLDIKLIRFCC